ncbi:MAG: nucleotidyltransferase family protein [Candidatus Jacksonbacteria bacterium]|nr:nucleotidyltransferase family protein [Candidatus Jacksonbacteria bacterium]
MQRVRLTITLRKNLIDALDRYADGVNIRNRSHAIEALLTDAFLPRVTKAVILAADQGITFRPFTYEMPKAMLPIRGRPLLEHVIARLRQFDIRDMYISVGYLKEKIESYFGNGDKFGVHITYVAQEKKNVGTGGALKQFQPYLKDEPFFLIYADVLTNINYSDFAKFYGEHKSDIGAFALTTTATPELWGVVKLQGDRVLEFTEKPSQDRRLSHLISAGIYIFTPRVFSYITKNKKVSLEKDILPDLVKKHAISGYILESPWYDISTPVVYEKVLKEWK